MLIQQALSKNSSESSSGNGKIIATPSLKDSNQKNGE